MLPELKSYKVSGSFHYRSTDRLSAVCNAPADQAGIYVVYAVRDNQHILMYIGISGQLHKNGEFKVRNDGLRGRLISGKRDGEPRKNFWIRQMVVNRLNALHIFWYVTCTPQGAGDIPALIEKRLIAKY